MHPTFNSTIFSGHWPRFYGKTIRWFGSDLEENYNPIDNLYKPEDINYTFNQYGFRCDNFTENAKHRIVFLGCSLTQGIGVKLEESWAYVLLQLIKSETGYNIPFWNLALGGSGLDAQVRAYYHYYQMLQPKLVIGFIPPPYRRELYIGIEHPVTGDTPVFVLPHSDIFVENKLLLDEKNIAYECEKNFAMLDLMLQKYNTKMLWNGWGFDRLPDQFYTKHKLEIKYDRKARDSLHPGPKLHANFAEEIFNQYKETILSAL